MSAQLVEIPILDAVLLGVRLGFALKYSMAASLSLAKKNCHPLLPQNLFRCPNHFSIQEYKMTVRIQPQTYANAPETVKITFDHLKSSVGMVPNLYATIAKSPVALDAFLAFAGGLGKSNLSLQEKELINLAVSESNGCAYCLSAHTLLGGKAGLSQDQILQGRRGLGSTQREQAILDFVKKLARTGGLGTGGEVKRALSAGLSEAEVIEVIALIAAKQFLNAVAITAGVDIDFPRAPLLPEE
jgi:uncharacterized peroxidase-related enzyme